MPRPVIWALGTILAAGLSALSTGDRLAAMVGLSGPAPSSAPPAAGGSVLTIGADLQGHFVVHPSLDGRRIRMMVDTGASLVALSHEDAQRAGIRPEARDYNRPLSTANGTVRAASVRIQEMRVGDIVVRGVEAVVLPQGRLGTSLLGMSFLKRIGGFEVSQGRLTLRS